MPKEVKDPIKVTRLIVHNNPGSTSTQIRTISVDNATGDHNTKHPPREATTICVVLADIITKNIYAVYLNYKYTGPWEQHIYYHAAPAPYVTTPTNSSRASSQSSEVWLALQPCHQLLQLLWLALWMHRQTVNQPLPPIW
uniref:Uncharacterized protein n=1 Tax=Romanomermis culicivorax TaxID=13658 RepID=A0A915KZV5_ROMCU